MLNYKKYSISYLWIFLSLVWITLFAAAVWRWGCLLVIYDVRPLEGISHRLYAITVIILFWITGLLYCLTRKAKTDIPDAAVTDNVLPKPDEVPRPTAEQFFAENKHKLLNKNKELVLIAQIGETTTSPLIENLLRLGLADKICNSGSADDNQIGWAEAASAIYAECCLSILPAYHKAPPLWDMMIKQLARRKVASPVDSLIITMSYRTITNELQWQNAQTAILDNLDRLRDRLGYVPPLYLLVKDAGMISGFTEYFQNQSEPQNHALLGVYIPLTTKTGFETYRTSLAREFKTLQNMIETQVPEKLHQISDQHMRDAIFRFPARFADFHQQYRLRLEQLAVMLFQTGNLPPRVNALACCKTNDMRFLKNFFLYLRNDSTAIQLVPVIHRRKRRKRLALLFTSVIIAGVSLAVWHYAIQQSKIYLTTVNHRLKSAEAALSEMDRRPEKSFPLAAIMNPLMITWQLMDELNNSRISKLISGTELRNSIISTHDQLADKYLLPQIVHALEVNLRLEGTDDDSLNHLFDTLALYLNLSGRLSLPVQDQQQLLENIFQNLEPELAPRAQMLREFLRVFRSGRTHITPDNSLIEQAQSRLIKLSQASRVLYILADNNNAPRWRASDIVGPDADEIIFVNLPASSSCSISGLYTRAGFETVVIPRFSDALQKVINSRQVWADPEKTDIKDLGRDTLITYAGRFNQIWATYLQHITLQLPDHTITTNEGLIQTRHSYNARLRKLLTNIADQTNLTPHLAKPDSQLALASSMSLWQEKIPYAQLRAFLSNNKAPGTEQPLLDQLFTTLDLIEKYTYRLSQSDGPSDISANIERKLLEQYQNLHDLTPDLPAPLRQWIEQFTKNSRPALRTAIRQSVGELWNKQNYSICKKLITNRYPFSRNASADISMEDFAQLFGSDGIFARFTNEILKSYIETDSLPWRWRQHDLAASFSQNSLEMFEQADRIRRSFFLSGSKTPAVTVNIKALTLPAGIEAAIMQIEGFSVTGTPQQKDVVSVNWPAKGSNRTSKLVVFTDSWHEIASVSGPWSFFRLLDKGKIKQESTGQFRVTFNAQGKPVSFLADFSALFPAYNKALLEGFQCREIS